MRIYSVPAGPLRANSYIVTEDGKNAVLIDCGGNEPLLFAEQKGIKIDAVLLTHGHFDHIGGCAAAQAAGAKIGCPEKEKRLLSSDANLASAIGVPVPSFLVDFTYNGGDVLDFFGLSFRVIATPGHTPGGVCFLAGDALFTGDTLFCRSVGRTDFPGGSISQLRESLRKLFALEGNPTVYPGHDEQTTLDDERKYNPYAF